MSTEIEFWVIMDRAKKVIAVGSPRNRELRKLSELGKVRIMLYGTEQKAKSGITSSGFYGVGRRAGDLIPVKAKLIIE